MPRIAQRCQPERSTTDQTIGVDAASGFAPDALMAMVCAGVGGRGVTTPADVRFVDTRMRACDVGRNGVAYEPVLDAWTRCTALRGLSPTGRSGLRAPTFVHGCAAVHVDVQCAAVLLL